MDNIVIKYGATMYNIAVILKQVKNITIKVHVDQRIELIANPDVDSSFLRQYAEHKIHWIHKKINEFKSVELDSIVMAYVSGESFRYLGRQYRLKIIEDSVEKVAINRNYITIRVKDKNNYKRKQKLFEDWLSYRCSVTFNAILNNAVVKFSGYDILKPELKIRKMKNRWGSYKDNVIILNKKLIQKARIDIEYVVIHELSHIIYPDHSPQFYRLLSVLLPDWRERKNHLDGEW